MKAYQNSKGVILAVFKDDSGLYKVYARADKKAYFKKADQRETAKATRAEAEADMVEMAHRSHDKTWKLIDFRG